jgi:alpha-beta hydrolase superfamily lysophospholipase
LTQPSDRSRRSALLAGMGLAAAPLLPLGAPAPSSAGSTPSTAARVVADEFWADKKGVRLWVYRKRLEGSAPAQRLFCVHGSSYSGKTMFDLQVPNRSGYSMMDHFARLGYEVWTMDHEGYGHSQKTAGNSDIQSGVDDLKAAMAVIEKAGAPAKLAFFGQSSGALRAGRFANQYPEHVEKLALDALVWTGKDAPTLAQRAKNLARYQESNRRPVNREFYESVFTRDHSGAAEAMLGAVVADEELRYGDSVPTGTYVDMVTRLPLVDPEKIRCPVMITRAEHDGIATDEDILGFYAKLPSADKQLLKIGGLAHTAMLGVNRGRFYHALDAFLSLPPLVDLQGARQH